MKKLLSVSCALLISFSSVFAQDGNIKYGGVSTEDILFSSYPKDPSAEAVVVYDIGESYFFESEGGYDIRFTRTKRVKVFTEAGIKYASITIPYYHADAYKTEMVREIEATSYNLENGQIIRKELDPKTIFDEVINERWNRKKFVIPDVKPGTIFEFRYIVESPFHFNLPDWEFQTTIPTMYSKYVAKMIPFYEYVYIAQGISKFDFSTKEEGKTSRRFGSGNSMTGTGFDFKDMIYTYGMKDVPAFRDEAYITSPEDYIAKIDFQLSRFHSPYGQKTEIMTTWPLLIQDIGKNEMFGGYIKRCRKAAEGALAKIDLAGQESEEAKCRLIIEYVKSNIRWNDIYGKYADKNPKDLLTQKKGSAPEINLFMIAMLQAAGFEVYPVILSTRDNGKIKTSYPFESFFNYVIAQVTVDGKTILADGTEPLLAWNRIPPRCINEKGFLIKEGEETWINLSENIISTDKHTFNIIIDPEKLVAESKVILNGDEYDSYAYKSRYINDSVKINEGLRENGFDRVSSIKTSNFNDATSPYLIEAEGETDIEVFDKSILVNPFLEFPVQKNPLTQNTRSYHIDMVYPSANIFESRIKIPEGYKVSGVPGNLEMNNDLMSMTLKYEVKDGYVEATGNYTFKKAVYKASDYPLIKMYINNIVDKFNSDIVFEKL